MATQVSFQTIARGIVNSYIGALRIAGQALDAKQVRLQLEPLCSTDFKVLYVAQNSHYENLQQYSQKLYEHSRTRRWDILPHVKIEPISEKTPLTVQFKYSMQYQDRNVEMNVILDINSEGKIKLIHECLHSVMDTE